MSTIFTSKHAQAIYSTLFYNDHAVCPVCDGGDWKMSAPPICVRCEFRPMPRGTYRRVAKEAADALAILTAHHSEEPIDPTPDAPIEPTPSDQIRIPRLPEPATYLEWRRIEDPLDRPLTRRDLLELINGLGWASEYVTRTSTVCGSVLMRIEVWKMRPWWSRL